ncbi:putative bifunctional diguanylate cyclase/phosphodiesterase [Clostridium coskatii]|uniref:Cyclic di-GMP phosphodiesterase Gmr n=1 Tax=Clostridium coskatii TaxID=1705578 RepID=A0A162L105_9CLOT|nr:phosphodiesterase [Clostridium coskatii]OAA87016.1 Cyclic di-GMP phosphodiesterase Gmr [Clostridium coskatii]OBR97779.1 cyclic di-GMP phosphodiesterase Gmr [Clostridium coskatii]
MIKKIINKIRKNFFVQVISKNPKLQIIFNSVIMLALTIFLIFTFISYKTLKDSYNNETNMYQNGYLTSAYANKINEDIWIIRLYALYSVNDYMDMKDKVDEYEKDVEENINKYTTLHDLTNEEKDLVVQFKESNKKYSNRLNELLGKLRESKAITNDEKKEIMNLGDRRIELSKEMLNYSDQYIKSLSDKNETIKEITLRTIIAINFAMILLFSLMMFVVTKISKKIDYYAFHNCVTDLPNKNYVLNTLVKEIPKINTYSILISLDMDNFKAVNDTLGHISGDEFLKQAGRRFKKVMHIQDYICHNGGDEFLFLIRSVKNKDEAEVMLREILNVFKKPFNIYGKNVDYVTASLGVAVIPKDGNNFEILYKRADDAMYESKRIGKHVYSFYNDAINVGIYEDTIKKKAIEDGIKNGEFKVFYQPKISKHGEVLGAEALVRWIKEDNKIIPPSEFIDFAEREGLIKYIGKSVIVEVCKNVSNWIDKGYKNFKIAVNLSTEQLIDSKLCDNLLEIIEGFKVPFEYIEFEVTETTVAKNFDEAVNNINKIRANGIKISLDDFGTGYSSLNYLKNMPIDVIKIDKSFVDDITSNEASVVMVNTIISLSHYFGYEVVAEGVEEIEQIENLKSLGCDIFQGYYYGKPMEDTNFENGFLKLRNIN